MNWQLQMQHIFGVFYLGEKLFSAVYSIKHSHYLLGVGDEIIVGDGLGTSASHHVMYPNSDLKLD